LEINIHTPWHGPCNVHAPTPDDRVTTKIKTTNKTKAMKLNTHMHKTAVAVCCILSLSPALLFAAGTPKPIKETGVIKSVDMDAHTLVVTRQKKKSEQKFEWNDQTKFNEQSKHTSASALKEGEHVNLSYTPGGDTPVLKSVKITATKAKKQSAGNISPTKSNRA
jgi:Cu/Ag efflux protein CusF